MKLVTALVFLVSATGFVLTVQAYDTALAERLVGRILLQVEEHGEAWYVRTSDAKRYYMKNGAAAYTMMRFFSLGITDNDLAKIPSVADTTDMNASSSVCSSNELAQRLAGEILLQVEEHGEAWYLDPQKCRRIYMADGDVAYEIMRFLGLGILNANLEKLEVGQIAEASTDSDTDSQTEDFDPASHGSPHPKVASDSIPDCCNHPYYHGVYRAFSSDAVTWQKEGILLQDHASVPAIIERDDGSYVLYYVDGRYDTMDCQVSTDGETFTDGDCTIYGFTQERAWDPYVVKLPDSDYYRLYFVSPPSGPGATTIRSALSKDGISWLEEDDVRFEMDDLAIIDPAVVKMGDVWRMYAWYESTPGSATMVTATSPDGLTFTQESEFEVGGGIPEVVQLESGVWGLYVCSEGISLTTSQDGLSDWSSLSTVLSADRGEIVCDPSIIKMLSGEWEMVYKVQETH